MPEKVPAIVALVTACALVLSVVLAWTGVRDAATIVARGDAQRASAHVRLALEELTERPTESDLDAIRESLASEGVRFVAIVDRRGEVASGTPVLGLRPPIPLPGDVDTDGSTVRSVSAIVPPPWYRARPPPRATSAHQVPRLVVEVDAPTASALEARASATLAVGLLSAMLAVLSAVALQRATRGRERALAEAARARHLSALGEMSAVLAHEIKNPLASLKGHAQLMEESFTEGTKEHAKAERIVREATRIERLTDDLLAFVRSGAIARAPIDPRSIVRSALEGTSGVTVDDARAPQTVEADGERLRGALENLVRNAVQASPAPGSVEVSVAADAAHLVVAVRDRGAGIPPGDEARIFEPFHTTRTHGTGLGLAIARRVAEAHGGTLVAASREGGGAELTLRIPLRS